MGKWSWVVAASAFVTVHCGLFTFFVKCRMCHFLSLVAINHAILAGHVAMHLPWFIERCCY
ncbi:hypothetical protein SINU_05155 [Sporolactobacillus inulinus CASD]|uniref:Uncharacterized protein n=1 Tax=Sporolactobacillus inulinus CASD TaxID=1069536 RepID=A0A0U1QQD5_9BACL|nr:hypothetical protein SINU_05155 [Sporolactobacillus inulinus CASD]